MAGGQPISLGNLHKVRALCNEHGIRIIHDATRVAENAYFIEEREPGYATMSIAEIVRAICDLTDGCTMSAKKDALVNIGGCLALNEWEVFEACRNLVVVYEGLHTYGGMAGRDMEAVASGLGESVQFDHIKARVGQVKYLGEKLQGWGIDGATMGRRRRVVPGAASGAIGHQKRLVVEHSGIEPLTSWVRSRRSPS